MGDPVHVKGDHVPVDDPGIEERWDEIDRRAEDARSDNDSLAGVLKASIDRVVVGATTECASIPHQ